MGLIQKQYDDLKKEDQEASPGKPMARLQRDPEPPETEPASVW